MFDALKPPDPPGHFVLLTGYFSEGEPYGALGLTVSPTATEVRLDDIVQSSPRAWRRYPMW